MVAWFPGARHAAPLAGAGAVQRGGGGGGGVPGLRGGLRGAGAAAGAGAEAKGVAWVEGGVGRGAEVTEGVGKGGKEGGWSWLCFLGWSSQGDLELFFFTRAGGSRGTLFGGRMGVLVYLLVWV